MKRDALILWLLEVQLAEIAEARRGTTVKEERGRELEKQLHTFVNRKVVQVGEGAESCVSVGVASGC